MHGSGEFGRFNGAAVSVGGEAGTNDMTTQNRVDQGRLTWRLSAHPRDVERAMQLRYQVFAEELQARIHSPGPGLESDAFDAYCEHLLVEERDTGKLVGYTRLLGDEGARSGCGFYSQSEFDMDAVLALPGRRVEVGRTCIHRDHRDGVTIAVLWSGIGAYLVERRVDYLIGCASIPLEYGFEKVHLLIARLLVRHGLPAELPVQPRHPLPEVSSQGAAASGQSGGTDLMPVPPLLKAYLRLGGRLSQGAHWDEDFRVADMFVLVERARMPRRYRQHFVGDA